MCYSLFINRADARRATGSVAGVKKMKIAYLTGRTTNPFTIFSTRKEAVEHILGELGSDYANDFWASDDGESIEEAGRKMVDFTVDIFDSIADLSSSLWAGADTEVVIIELRELANAIEIFERENA
jgi:hypothetical protein